MDIYCTRPGCPKPRNSIRSFQSPTSKTSRQHFCRACAMPLILNHRYLPIELLRTKTSGATFLAKICILRSRDLRSRDLRSRDTSFSRLEFSGNSLGNWRL
ncbi:4-Cys prefix domain-containing protein [Egbenema bharatensis]|uniref:4-Cys prefix domain-containing protein n=1 Tax=Egbenema bharatensis TaxID=3463334 RepID=UPI003A8B9ACC